MGPSNRKTKQTLTYKDAGVDVETGNTLVQRIKSRQSGVPPKNLLHGIGGFAALYELPVADYQHPVMVSSTDGVGTKLLLALESEQYEHLGIDLVAMCVNDIVCCGAEPVGFLDYFATGQLNPDVAEAVIGGIMEGCSQAGCHLIGGETAEMPGLYDAKDFDIAGFCWGLVEKDQIIDGSQVHVGDKLIGIAASGVHANGFSLVRKIIERGSHSLDTQLGETTLREALLAPTRIYTALVKQLKHQVPLHAIAHITGGGIVENLPRVLPDRLSARIDAGSWDRPSIFDWLATHGPVSGQEMLRTFNCGIGLILAVPADHESACLDAIHALNDTAWTIGEIIEHDANSPRVIVNG